MIYPMDLIAGVICGFMAACFFAIHVITSPERPRWFTLPPYLRFGIAAAGILFMVRSVNLLTLSGAVEPNSASEVLGHMNWEGLLSLVVLAYNVGALTLWAAMEMRQRHPRPAEIERRRAAAHHK